ncbi:MAG TPA: ribonuclease H-like domain-containing protein [Ignavibacteria bacterium]|nr:ribonuclease H-like domain-containing protein [Ignavibacteria bacterium]
MSNNNNKDRERRVEMALNPYDRRILVFDIEVAPYDFETTYSDDEKKYLTKYAKGDEEIKLAIDNLVFTPFTSEIVAIGMLDARFELKEVEKEITAKSFADLKTELSEQPREWELKEIMGCVLINSEDATLTAMRENVKFVASDEKGIVENFWNYIKKNQYNLFVTFNGREFDCPYIMLKSLVHGIKPSYNLMKGNDFNIRDYHVDLMKEFIFNKHSPTGARRKFSLDWYCKKLGITSPKTHGVTGDMVGELYRQGRVKEIADYCYEDVFATMKLFERWNNTLNIR